MALHCKSLGNCVVVKHPQLIAHKMVFGTTGTCRTLTSGSNRQSTDSVVRKFLKMILRGDRFISFQNVSRDLLLRANQQFNILSQQFAKQCYGIVTQRIRRSAQTIKWYKDLGYDKNYVADILKKLSKSIVQRKPFFGIMAAVPFSWKDEQITENEVHKVESEIEYVNRSAEKKTAKLEEHFEKEWEKVIDRPNLLAWRRPVPGSSFYQYKLYGTVDDLPARAFYNAQIDIDYRRKWDKYIIKLDVVDRHRESNSEVVHWVTHFPAPMYPREYVFVRKFKVDNENNLMYTVARSCSHPIVPASDKYVRVETYMSNMVIRPFTTFDEDGFDYILTYYDEPKSNIPTFALNWVASSGVPEFAEKMYAAARHLHKHGKNHSEEDNKNSRGRVAM